MLESPEEGLQTWVEGLGVGAMALWLTALLVCRVVGNGV